MTTPRLLLPALAVLALSACAHAPRERLSAAPDGALAQDRSFAQEAEAPATPERVLVTGSRIRRPVDPVTGRVSTFSPLNVITREQILASGRASDVNAALLRLDPSLSTP